MPYPIGTLQAQVVKDASQMFALVGCRPVVRCHLAEVLCAGDEVNAPVALGS